MKEFDFLKELEVDVDTIKSSLIFAKSTKNFIAVNFLLDNLSKKIKEAKEESR